MNSYLYLESSSVYENVTYGNEASSNAGGITTINPGASMYIINSTISSNDGVARGTATGGIVNLGTLTLVNSTVALNIASFESGDYGSGILNLGTLFISNSIVAKNGPSNESGVDGKNLGTLNDGGYNLIGINDGFNLTSPTNKLGTLANPLDPLLGPLKNNGGSTLTHALLTGSLAIDQGNLESILAQDQRGIARPFNGIIDIGSYEVSGTPPAVTITSPASGSLFTEPANITIAASVSGAGEGAYLQVTNPAGGYRKLKLGYDSIGIYHGSQNVIASGNNTLEITLRDFTGTADWTKIQIRPNGSTASPLALAPYVAAVGGIGNSFRTIKIPLSDFSSSINFSHLTLFELPYSNNAPSFNIGVQKIIFTGGTTPFLWFGDRKTDNSFDGTGGPGELVAVLKPASGFGGVNNVTFFNGNTKIAVDVTAPYSFVWKNVPDGTYNLTAVATTNNGTVVSSAPVVIKVLPASALFSSERSGNYAEQAINVYPNPFQDKLYISGMNGQMHMSVFNDIGDKVYENVQTEEAFAEADLSALPAGLYILKVEKPDEKVSKVVKLVKQ